MNRIIPIVANVHITRKNPLSLVHFVTNRCNARCSFCFIDFDDPATFRNELTVDEIDKMTRTLGPSLTNVNLTGGEPFARKELLDIARCYFRNTNVESIFITSNGSLPNRIEKFIDALEAEFPSRKLIFSFSIDGAPEQHDRIRKIEGLFENVMKSYHAVRARSGFADANVSITVSHDNYKIAPALYDMLIDKYGVRAITLCIVRDEGVYRIPVAFKRDILAAYETIASWIVRDLKTGRLEGYDQASLRGRLQNKKNEIMYGIIKDVYLTPHFISQCRAGSLFGIIQADGAVHPCEVLDRPMGNIRDYDYDFMRLWQDHSAKETRQWIRDTKCNCSYECAWSFNILSNARYQPALIGAALGQ